MQISRIRGGSMDPWGIRRFQSSKSKYASGLRQNIGPGRLPFLPLRQTHARPQALPYLETQYADSTMLASYAAL